MPFSDSDSDSELGLEEEEEEEEEGFEEGIGVLVQKITMLVKSRPSETSFTADGRALSR